MNKLCGKEVLLFGDSIMFGSGNGGYGVGEYLERDLQINLKKYCVGGARMGYREGKSWIVEQVREAIASGERAQLIIFDGFTNDCYKTDGENCDVPLGEAENSAVSDIFKVGKDETFSQCFESCLAAFKTYFPEAKVLFIRPHRMGRREEGLQIEYGERAVSICEKRGVAVVDLYEASGLDTFKADHRDQYTCDSYGWGKGDCTHPNAAGYEKFYMPLIEEAIAKL